MLAKLNRVVKIFTTIAIIWAYEWNSIGHYLICCSLNEFNYLLSIKLRLEEDELLD